MKSILSFTFCFSILFFSKITFAQNCFFAKQMGGAQNNNIEVEQGNAIALDANGNVYTAGQFTDTSDFDPGVGVYNLIASGPNQYGAYVSKLDASGNFVWAVMPTGDATAVGMAVDQSGNIYVTGLMYGQVDFDPGAGTLLVGNSFDVQGYIWKLNSSGNVVWVKTIGNQSVNSIAIDSNGDVYFSGLFSGTVDFNPGAGTYNLTATKLYESYLAKLTSAGAFSWAIPIGGRDNGINAEKNLAIDNNGNVVVSLFLEYPADVDPSGNTTVLTNQAIIKYTANGSFVWGKSLDVVFLFNSVTSIALDASNNIFIGGQFTIPFDADPGNSVYTLTPNAIDIFVIKLNPLGNFLWAQQIGAASMQLAGPIAIDNSGSVYVTGYRDLRPEYPAVAFDLDPGTGTFILPEHAISYLVKLNASGNFMFGKALSTSISPFNVMVPKGIVIDQTKNIYATGFFIGTANAQDYNPDPTISFHLNTPGKTNDRQIFISKFSSLTATASYTNITCNGDNNGTATATVLDGNPPYTYQLDSLPAVTNNVFTGLKPGKHIITVVDANGCTQTAPSFIITEPSKMVISTTSTQESCVGGGSNGTATAQVNGGSPNYTYSWNTTPVQTTAQATGLKAGNYIVTVSDKNNCIDTAHVMVTKEYNPSEFTYAINGMVVSFSITGTGCNSFLWDFGNGNTSSINTAPIITYASSGIYNACLQCNSQPSSCVTCKSIQVPNNSGLGNSSSELNSIKIFPNPSNGIITIERNSLVIHKLKVVSVLGEILIDLYDFEKSALDLTSLPKGFYIIEIEADSTKFKQKIIVQ
jgi:hypothetical protein